MSHRRHGDQASDKGLPLSRIRVLFRAPDTFSAAHAVRQVARDKGISAILLHAKQVG
jgi:hypothetical protein